MTDETKELPISDTIPEVDNSIQGEEGELGDETIPDWIAEPNHLLFIWKSLNLLMHVRRFNNPRCVAEVEVWYHNRDTGQKRLILPTTQLELRSPLSRQAVVKQLTAPGIWYSDLNWEAMLGCVVFKTIDVIRTQEPIYEVMPDPTLALETQRR